jgi:hypothetical protein
MKTFSRKQRAIFIGVLTLVMVMLNYHTNRTRVRTHAIAEFGGPGQGATKVNTVPELPRVYLDTTYVPPKGRTIRVPKDGNLQAAFNEARLGDVVMLQAGATYTGNFTLPAKKTGSGWIIIRTSAPDSSLPPLGTRITPSYADLLPKIVSPNSAPALEFLDNAHHYRLIGLEFTVAKGVPQTYNLLLLGEKQSSLASLPHDLIIDRVYIHGNPTINLRRGIMLHSASTAIIDSYISDCHEVGADSQAIGGFNGPGPYKIVNNYLEGAGENIMFGGDDPFIPNLVPSDIEFRYNHCFKPLSWRIGDPTYAGKPWGIKNLFELKNAQRILIDGNIFENNWAHAQNGFAILFTVRNHNGVSPNALVQDVTFTNNIVRNSASGFNMHGDDNNIPGIVSRRIRIANNLIEGIDGKRWGGAGIAFQLNGGPHEMIIEHNTILHVGNVLVTGVANENMIFRNNLFRHNEYGIKGDSRGSGKDTIDAYFPGSSFLKNLFIGGDSSLYPRDNFFVKSIDDVGFVNRTAGNYRLAEASRFKNAGTDGKDIGCDMDALSNALSAVNGKPTNTVRLENR